MDLKALQREAPAIAKEGSFTELQEQAGLALTWREGVVTTTICEHENFRSTVVVNRLVNVHLDFSADVKIKCADCGRPFVFLGLPRGLALQGAAISFDAQEARLAIKPSSTEGNVL